jgi:hypothetical protein
MLDTCNDIKSQNVQPVSECQSVIIFELNCMSFVLANTLLKPNLMKFHEVFHEISTQVDEIS